MRIEALPTLKGIVGEWSLPRCLNGSGRCILRHVWRAPEVEKLNMPALQW